jgi:hypothetical protein
VPTVRAYSNGETSITVEISDLQYSAINYDYFSVVVYKNNVKVTDKSWSSSRTSNYTSTTVSGLSPGTRYWVDAYAKWKGTQYHCGGDSVTTDEEYVPPPPPPPSKPSNFRVTNTSRNSISVAWSPSSSATSYNLFLDGRYDGVTGGTTYTFNGLQPDTWYTLGVEAYDSSSGQYSDKATTSAKTLKGRPSNWNWSYNIYSGGNVFKTTASDGIIKAYIMTAYEWNNFTKRINEFREYKGLSNYNFTTVYAEGDCTPSIINQAVNAINAMGFNIATVSSVVVPANVFIQMRDKLNSIY